MASFTPDSPTLYCNGNSARLLAGSLADCCICAAQGVLQLLGERTLQPHCPQGHITEGVLGSEVPPEQVPGHERGRGVYPGGSTACSGSPRDTMKRSCAQLCWSTSGLMPGPSPLSCWASSATVSGAAQPSPGTSPACKHPKWAQRQFMVLFILQNLGSNPQFSLMLTGLMERCQPGQHNSDVSVVTSAPLLPPSPCNCTLKCQVT